VWRSRCASTSRRFGGHVILTLTRWDASQPPTPHNLVLLMQNEAQKLHEHGKEAFPKEVVARIEERLAWAKKVCEDSWETLDHTGGPQQCPVRVVPNRRSGANLGNAVSMVACGGTPLVTGVCVATLAFMLGYGASRYVNR
jgi:hypothetical protein